MKLRDIAALAALGLALTATQGFAQSPGWFLQKQSQSANLSEQGAAPGGPLAACADDMVKTCIGKVPAGRACLSLNQAKLSSTCKATLAAMPPVKTGEGGDRCNHSPLCATTIGGTKPGVERVEWKQTMGYSFAYPFALPPGANGGVSGVAVDSKDNLWAFQRNPRGTPQLFEFDANHKLIRTIGENVIGHQDKAHGIKVDAGDNVWICDESGATVMKLSPQGKLLMTIGVKGKRGDWNEAKGQHLLWQPLDVAFGTNGDIYIGQGHADESPNDTDSSDPADNIGAARVLHLDKTGKFINQWYGNSWGPGKFTMVHGIGVDPKTGTVWIADREQYRLVAYAADGKFVKTLSMRNLTCAVTFDPHGQMWVATGNDGQLIKVDANGTVLGAIGNGRGTGPGQFMETNFMAMDSHGNLYSGDTTVGRVTQMVAAQK